MCSKLPQFEYSVRYDGMAFGLNQAFVVAAHWPAEPPPYHGPLDICGDAPTQWMLPLRQALAVNTALEFARNHPDFVEYIKGRCAPDTIKELDAFYRETCNKGRDINDA